jgi:hypothetical protein
MAFSGSSYFAGIGTAFAAIAVGFAGGAMITTRAVQPPNRLERVHAGPVAPSKPEAASSVAASSPEQANPAKPATQDAPASTIAAAPAADPQMAPHPQPAAPAVAKVDKADTDKADTKTAQEQPAPAAKNPPSAPVARSEDAPTAKSERTTVGRAPDPGKDVARSADSNKETARKKADDRRPSDDRKFSERRRRQDPDTRRLDEATNVVRQMPRGEAVGDDVVEVPRFRERPRRFELFGDDDSPHMVNGPPPRFGFFGD